MTELDEPIRAVADDRSLRPRPSASTVLGAAALLLAPIAGSIGGALELLAIGSADPASDPSAFLGAVESASGLWTGMGIAMLAMALLTMAWTPAVWRLAHGRSRRWAWAAASAGALFAFGQAVHLVSWVALTSALASALPADDALRLIAALESSPIFMTIFAPYLLGALLAPPIAAVALWRSRQLPVWSIPIIAVASVAMLLLGTSSPLVLIGYPLLWIAAFAPALGRLLGRSDSRA